jgi:hypothetical protein
MTALEFLAQLNDAEKEWGLWIDRNNLEEYHVGHYSYEHDRMPKSFLHVGKLEELAHLRQKYILDNVSSVKSDEILGLEWAKSFISQWTESAAANP